jgi:hypothetical protein
MRPRAHLAAQRHIRSGAGRGLGLVEHGEVEDVHAEEGDDEPGERETMLDALVVLNPLKKMREATMVAVQKPT